MVIVDENTFDIDNIDIEEQMDIQDLEEEQEAEEKSEEERLAEEAEKLYYKSRRTLNAKNLIIDLDIPAEAHRPKYIWESLKDEQIYEGYVVHKFDKTSFIFNCTISGMDEYKLRKINLNNIKQIKQQS